ncbi:MAG: hypothetical protein AAGE52_41845 [Myxococcota bacterium]
MHRLALLCVVFSWLGCGDDSGGPIDASASDSGASDSAASDSAAADSAADGAPDGGPDASVEMSIPLPIFRIGPRNGRAGAFGPFAIEATVALPEDTDGFTDFDDWTFAGHGGAHTFTVGETRREGGRLVADVAMNLTFATDTPGGTRELVTARSASGAITLVSVIDADDRVTFDLASAARQALSLATLSEDESFFQEAYFFGAREGDDAALDAEVAEIVTVMETQLRDAGDAGLNEFGFARTGTPVFEAIDRAVGSEAAPTIVPPASARHLGILEGVAGSTVALWVNEFPSVHFNVPEGASRAGFFFFVPAPDPELDVYARTRDGGGDSAASQVFRVPASDETSPPDTTLELTADGARACGGEAGNQFVFFASATELAVGFALREPGADGCATLPSAEISPEALLLSAAQITPELEVGPPSASVFP